MSVNRQNGFTLLEVLIAGFILFLTIAAMTMVYRGAMLSSAKAESSLEISAAVPSIRQSISSIFQAGDLSGTPAGEGRFGQVGYYWSAKMTYSGQPAEIILEDSGAGEDLVYFLWQVDLRVTLGSVERTYKFSEISW